MLPLLDRSLDTYYDGFHLTPAGASNRRRRRRSRRPTAAASPVRVATAAEDGHGRAMSPCEPPDAAISRACAATG